jgi:ParB family transcriptional regulator, chromosome partitioning protein
VVDGQPAQFEIVYGHRRCQACLEEGVPVNAEVVEVMTDLELFEAMARENRGRKNLSAYEQGVMYQDALKKGLYSSARKMEDALNLNHSDCTRALQLAKLPITVIKAFASPLDLQYRWAGQLAEAMQKDPEGLLLNAKKMATDRGALSATEVFQQLIAKPGTKAKQTLEIVVAGKKLAALRHGPKGRAVLEFETDVLRPDKSDDLITLIKNFLAN